MRVRISPPPPSQGHIAVRYWQCKWVFSAARIREMADSITIEKKLHSLLKNRERLSAQLEMLDGDIAACERVLKIVSPSPRRPSPPSLVGSDEVLGMSIEEALVFIAQHHDGQINTYQARPFLIEAGVLRGEPARTSRLLNDVLRRSKRFERSDGNGKRGNWHLIPSDSADSSESDLFSDGSD